MKRRHSQAATGDALAAPPQPPPPPRNDDEWRSLYVQPVDFRALGRRDKEFGKFLTQGTIDFTDPAAVMQLTKTLLQLDFGLAVEMPHDRLCPPVPNRHNYILWLKDLLDTTDTTPGPITGLDIGTGASCIYPLLGCAQRAAWSFIATDIDLANLASARANVHRNGLDPRIAVLARTANQPLIPLSDPHPPQAVPESLAFVMTNPPFYSSAADLAACAAAKARPPLTACTGAPVEMVTEGGEVAFVGRLIDEGRVLRKRVAWYSAMLGKQASLDVLVGRLRAEGINNYAITEFVQGNKTRRWALAWSYKARRPAQRVVRGVRVCKQVGASAAGSNSLSANILPPVVESAIASFPTLLAVRSEKNNWSVDEVAQALALAIGKLHLLSWKWCGDRLSGVGRAPENVWSRAWRRKMARAQGSEPLPTTCAIEFKVAICVDTSGMATLSCRWTEGHDAALYESFKGFLKTTLDKTLNGRPGSTTE